MKNIKLFKYKDTSKFEDFLSSYDYSLEDVKGFELVERKQCEGNVLTEYCIHFKDDECACLKAVCFQSRNEYYQAKLGFKGEKLLN